MADDDPDSSNSAPQTAQSDGPTHREPGEPARTGGGGVLILFIGIALQYGFWIFVSAENGHDMSTLRWSIPFTLISLMVFGLSMVVGTPLDRLSTYCIAKGWAKAVNALSVTRTIFGVLMVAGNLCAVAGFVISIVASIDVGSIM
jgi:hypothetical protein